MAMNWPSFLPNRNFLILLVAYFIIQMISLKVHWYGIYIGYEIIFLLLIAYGIYHLVIGEKSELFRELKRQSIGLLIVGLLLTLFYFLAIISETSGNWEFKPNVNELSSLLLLFPLAQSITASILLLFTAIIKYSLVNNSDN